MKNRAKGKSQEKEKPPFLYHGSPHSEIEEFEPRISKGSGEKYGALVYATQDLATASIFMFSGRVKGWAGGRFNDVPCVLISMSRDEFIKNDKGGYIYILPSDTFSIESGRGLGEYEWASKERVKPIKKLEYPSALDAMLENGVQVYFVDKEKYRKIEESKDYSILKRLESENKRRGINVKL